MNRYLEKLAKQLPYRQRAEVLIHNRDGKVLVTVNKSDEGVWHGLPGGGIEGDQSLESAARHESLEEVGVALTNVRHSGQVFTKEGIVGRKGKEDRQKMFRGTTTHLMEADFDGTDTSSLGADGDAVKYKWVSPQEAYELLAKNHAKTGNGEHQLKALRSYI